MPSRAYSIAYGHTEEHARALTAGLTKLGAGFSARLCGVCNGHGEYQQTYTAGCGQGYFRSMGVCDWCDGLGLRQGDGPASASVVNQVLNAANER